MEGEGGCPLRQVRAGCEHEEEDIYGLWTQAPVASGGVGLPEGDSLSPRNGGKTSRGAAGAQWLIIPEFPMMS